ncbi:hypothetical protein L226DRAFT_569957 [Lentinus tigrinus ALCF2SS1-7]|uniref:EXPERA domain-containing protein n=1 Tax=Lentinus tigrinus ALCF2SS1-6 TaxID=1328759 RepID=A0A5C2RMV9_9APHY|nr:hypothetical protein L227DRAFT_617645 [Lentinus tigrinus ALCF2SS1-6]RPD76741.1 hypothetical protein L226DRAFT_569957 [Lentinus tigrinus ALCF2SS1-7]
MLRIPFSERPRRDFIYFIFFCVYGSTSIFIDTQYLYPEGVLPEFLTSLTSTKSIYPLLVIWGASTATTVYTAIGDIIGTPIADTPANGPLAVAITAAQRRILILAHFPYLVIPLVISIDMAYRLHVLASGSTRKLKTL